MRRPFPAPGTATDDHPHWTGDGAPINADERIRNGESWNREFVHRQHRGIGSESR
jgi:hypothetical protein